MTQEIAGKIARRVMVAVAGALGVSAASQDSVAWQVGIAALAAALVAVAEFFSARHDEKIVEKAKDNPYAD